MRKNILECHDIVARFDGCHALANGLNNAGAFMAKDDGESAFWIFAG